LELNFPIEFIVQGTAVSSQAKRARSKAEWKARIKKASSDALPDDDYFLAQERVSITLFYFPAGSMQGDIDVIAKPVLDALCNHIYQDDKQVERLVVQKFEPGNVFPFASPCLVLSEALAGRTPLLYIRVSDRPFEELV
jgi:crossover junction endodeoxyribonuclease RusA